jgi:hypothetical protein
VKRLGALGVAVVVVVGSAGAALAAWTIGSIGASGRGAARTLPTGSAPTATATGTTVTVSFTQVSLGGSPLGSLSGGGYTVKRYSSGGAVQTVSGPCSSTVSGLAAVLSCAETNAAGGTWYYRVTPVLSGWRGTESSASPGVTVDATPPIVTVTAFAGATAGKNTKVAASGTGTIGDGSVKVYVCQSTPCSAATAVNAGDPYAAVTLAGTLWTYTSPNLGSRTYYLVAQQTDAAGNTGTSNTAGPVTR